MVITPIRATAVVNKIEYGAPPIVLSVKNGIFAVDMNADRLKDDELERYRRNILLPEIGLDGQMRLRAGRVLIVGAGGLGSPAALFLAAAGVGTIGLVDGDDVDLTNLQRQIAHSTADIGRPKVRSAAEKLRRLNPEIEVETHRGLVTADNASRMFAGYDFVIDATDNYEAKFLINDVCVSDGKPYCHGGVREFRGQVMTYVPGTACFRCVFPEPPDNPEPSSRFGVLGVLPGVVGTLQAAEAIKWLTGAGQLLVNRVLTVDLLSMDFRTVTVDVRRGCGCAVQAVNSAGSSGMAPF